MDRFLSSVRPHVPGCSNDWIRKAVLESAVRFCVRSRIWQQKMVSTVSPGASILVLTPSGAALEDVRVSDEYRDRSDYTLDGGTITFDDGGPATSTKFTVISILKPARDAPGLPDILYDDWFEGVEAGAKADLMTMPGKPWTNSGLAAMNQAKYLHSTGEAALQSRTQNNQAGLMVRPRRFV